MSKDTKETKPKAKKVPYYRRRDYYDYNLLAVVILLVAFGLVIMFSASVYDGTRYHNDNMYFLQRQAFFAVISIVLVIVLPLLVDYHKLMGLAGGILYFGSLILMAMVRSPFGMEINGARRWINIKGISFQPAELAKIAVIVIVPLAINYMGKKFRGFWAPVVALIIGGIPAAFAFFITSNLSTAIIIMMITVVIVFVAYPKIMPFIVVAIIGAGATFFGVMRIANSVSVGNFRFMRILVWLDPEKYSDTGGHQIMQGLYAMGSGGFFGKGLGNSMQKLGAVPEAMNDMVFSILCEELGVFGVIIVLLLFVYLLYRLFFIAQNAPDLYGALVVTGIFGHVALQVILNISVAINLIPTTGITMPFISYGGTALCFLMVEIAIAQSVARSIKLKSK
ncbi:MAG: FtsW/RodA/SpoVE family cell cycle protein [Lachnospiraceae bacterium]|nr:FtsW/RodA/SpoVE family cell cycle protein [Lachnospiraceae bacterium]